MSWFTATDNMTLDLAKELSEKTLGALVKAAHDNGWTPSDEAAETLEEKYGG